MKVIAICNKHIKTAFQKIDVKSFLLDGETIYTALLNVPDIDYKKYFKDDSVLVRIKAFSCNFRDKALIHLFAQKCKVLSGNNKYFFSPVGSDFVAEVIEVGKNVKELKIGDRVIPDATYPLRNDGSIGGIPTNYASQELNIFRENQLIKIPESIPDEIAAAFTIAGQTSYSIIRKLNLKKGDNILVTAATSNTSLAVLSILKNYPVNVYAISSKGSTISEKIQSICNTKVIPLQNLQDGSITEVIGDLKFDVVIDPFIDLYFENALPFTNFNAKYIFCGIYRQYAAYPNAILENNSGMLTLLLECVIKNISLIGNCLGKREDLDSAVCNYLMGRFNPVIDKIYTEENYLSFLNHSFSLEKIGKVVLKY